MLNAIIRFSLRHRGMVLLAAGLLLVLGSLYISSSAARRLSGRERAHGHRGHRSARHGAGRGRAAGDLPRGIRAQRRARRAAGALGLGGRHLGRVGGIRLGRGRLPRPPGGLRAPPGGAAPGERRSAPARPHQLGDGRDHLHRHDLEDRLAHGAAPAGRNGRAPHPALRAGHLPGGAHRRRRAGVPGGSRPASPSPSGGSPSTS